MNSVCLRVGVRTPPNRKPNLQFLMKLTTIRKNLGQDDTYRWVRVRIHLACHENRRVFGFAPVEINPNRGWSSTSGTRVWRPVARVRRPGLEGGGWLRRAWWWREEEGTNRGDGRKQKQKKKERGERGCRGGGIAARGEGEIRHAKLPLCPPLLSFIYSTDQT